MARHPQNLADGQARLDKSADREQMNESASAQAVVDPGGRKAQLVRPVDGLDNVHLQFPQLPHAAADLQDLAPIDHGVLLNVTSGVLPVFRAVP